MTKTCTKCNISKPLDEFHNDKSRKDGKYPQCKECVNKQGRNYYKEHQEELVKKSKKHYKEHREEKAKYDKNYQQEHKDELTEYKKEWYEKTGRQRKGHKSMYENKLCAQYLGIVIAERLIRHLFNDVEVMSYGNPGYDIICNKGMKIDVKSGCTILQKGKYPSWQFHIDENKVADYFICVAFDNLVNLNPLHLWMIPGKEVNQQAGISIRPSTIHKWDNHKKDIKNAQFCCAEIKKNSSWS